MRSFYREEKLFQTQTFFIVSAIQLVPPDILPQALFFYRGK
jgi:hypothetical protein